MLVKADTLLGKAVTDEDGNAVFDLDLPFGKYYIRELAAPAGYVSSDETLDVTAAYQGQDVKVIKLASEFKNQPTKITVKKSDITTGVELSGATLTVLDKDKNVIDEYNDTIENREEQVEKLTEDILNKKTEAIKDWLLEVSEESDIDSDVITARSLLSRLEDTERLSIFDKQPEQEQPEATISFYVAECMEFPVMGEYHNNLTLEEAIKIYESIPAERMHGGKGIGFDLQDGDKDYSGEYELMCWDRVDRELIDMIPHYKESPLVQKAINDMEKYLNEKHGKVQEAEQTVEVKQEVPEAPVKKESVSVEPNWEQNKEPAKGEKGELKKSVLQSLKEFQARVKAQEQKEMATEKSKAHKKGDVEL